jgi:hypothetical protein
MGIFSGVREAKVTEGGRYIEPGNYIVEIQRCKEGETRKKVEFFVAECRILESDNSNMKPGEEASWMVTADKDATVGNLKHFAMATTGCTEDEVDEAGLKEIVSERNPLAGLKMRVYAYNKPTQAGKPFTRVKWIAYDGKSLAETLAGQKPKEKQPEAKA